MLRGIVNGALRLVGYGSPAVVKGPEQTIGDLFGQVINPSSQPDGDSMQALLSNQFLTSALSGSKLSSAWFCDDSGIELRISRVVGGIETRSRLPIKDKVAADTARASLSKPQVESIENRPVTDSFGVTILKYSTDGHRYNKLLTSEEAGEVGRYTVRATYVSGDGYKRQLDLIPEGTPVQGQWGNPYGNSQGQLSCEGQIPIECQRGFPIKPTNGVHRDLAFEIYKDGQLVGTISGN